MRFTLKLSTFIALSGLFLTATASLKAADQQYNFSFELANSSGNDLLTDGSFYTDPSTATKIRGADAVGETYSSLIDSLAFTVFDLGTASNVGIVSYGASNLQNSGLAYYASFNPSSGLADPIFTLSAPDNAGYLTLVMNGSTDSFYQSSTLGSTSGTPLASGPAQLAQSLDATPVTEPASFGLAVMAGALLLGSYARRQKA